MCRWFFSVVAVIACLRICHKLHKCTVSQHKSEDNFHGISVVRHQIGLTPMPSSIPTPICVSEQHLPVQSQFNYPSHWQAPNLLLLPLSISRTGSICLHLRCVWRIALSTFLSRLLIAYSTSSACAMVRARGIASMPKIGWCLLGDDMTSIVDTDSRCKRQSQANPFGNDDWMWWPWRRQS